MSIVLLYGAIWYSVHSGNICDLYEKRCWNNRLIRFDSRLTNEIFCYLCNYIMFILLTEKLYQSFQRIHELNMYEKQCEANTIKFWQNTQYEK